LKDDQAKNENDDETNKSKRPASKVLWYCRLSRELNVFFRMKEMLNYYGGTQNVEKTMDYLETLPILLNGGILTENGPISKVKLEI
jgi:transposase